MTAPLRDTYPHQLAGAAARPPVPARPQVVAMARDARRRELTAAGLELPEAYGFVMPPYRLAACLVECREEANQANPRRDTSSDGTLGNAAHAGRGPGSPEWDDSDHNPWLIVAGKGVVRALDLDQDGLDLVTAFEEMRQLASAGALPQLVGGGYLIINGRITAYDFSGWRTYKGTNPHVLHGHISASRDPARFDDRRPWGVFGRRAPAPVQPPSEVRPRGPGWTGPDLRGQGLLLRGEQGANGVRVARLQLFMRLTYPLYAKGLADDGWWGPKTSSVLRQFAQRTGIRSADGLNIGPQVARKLYLAGFRG